MSTARAPRRNPTEFAILGLLAEEPLTGYDIKKEVEERLSSFWTESYGNIYPMLRRLRTRKLVAMKVVAGRGGPTRRKLYTITEAGRAALSAWFETPATPSRPRNEFLLRVFFGRHAPPGALERELRQYSAATSAIGTRLRDVRSRIAVEAPDAPDRRYWESVIACGERIFGELAAWSAETATRLGGDTRTS